MRRTFTSALIVIAGLIAMLPHTSHAGNSGYRITDARGQQTQLHVASDGNNRAFCFWVDDRTGSPQVYGQMFDSLGVKQWATDGIPIATTGPESKLEHLVADSQGGAWLIYSNVAGAYTTLRAQHVDSTGASLATGADAIFTDGQYAYHAPRDYSAAAIQGASGTLIISYQESNPVTGYNRFVVAGLSRTGTLSWLFSTPESNTYIDGTGICGDGLGGCFVLASYHNYYVRYSKIRHMDGSGIEHAPAIDMLRDQSNAVYNIGLLQRSPNSAYVRWTDAQLGQRLDIVAGDLSFRYGGTGRPTLFSIPFFAHNHLTTHQGAGFAYADTRWVSYDDNGDLQNSSFLSSSWWGLAIIASAPQGDVLAWTDSRDILPTAISSTIDIYTQQIAPSGAKRFSLGGIPVRQAPGEPANLSVATLGTRSLIAWLDPRRPNDSDAYAQIVMADGSMVWADSDAPRITSVKDTRNDQGGKLALTWRGSAFDDAAIRAIKGYRVWRRIPASSAAPASRADMAALRQTTQTVAGSTRVEYWESVGEVPAQQMQGYGAVVATTQDSLPGSNPYTAFFVSALTDNPFVFYDSPVDSGYSVDNLPPRAPLFAGARYEAGQNHLHWLPNTEADLNGYILYRGTHPDFVTDVTDPVAFVADTGYVDAATGPMYYKIAAVDRHGNRSAYITVLPTGNAGVGGGGLSLAFSLARPFPNPSDGSSLNVEFTLPTAAPATLEVLDVSGRCILRDDLAGYAAGRHTLDLAARVRMASGLYVVRLKQSGMSRTVRATVLN